VKYEIIIENSLKQTALKRVRIKVDPKLVCQTEDLSQCDGYEGYILAETGDKPKVLVMSPDGVSSVMDIPQQFLQMLMSDEESEALRAFKGYICDICELDTSTPEAEILLSASTIEEVEAILKQVGLSDDELKVLYRNFIADSGDVVSEGVFSNLLNKAQSTLKNPAAYVKGVGNIAKVAGGVYGALIGPKGAAVIKGAGDALTNLAKGINDKRVKGAIKKLERPPDGKDILVNDKFTIQLPLKGNITATGKVINVRGNTDQGKLVATIALSQTDLPVTKITIIDTGSVRAEIIYFNNAGQIPAPEISKDKWPTNVGLHKVAANSWLINTEIRDDKFKEFTNEIIDTLQHKDIKDKFDVTDQQLALLSRAKTMSDISNTLHLKPAGLQELLGYWATYYGPGATK